jgi:hypothetical protein
VTHWQRVSDSRLPAIAPQSFVYRDRRTAGLSDRSLDIHQQPAIAAIHSTPAGARLSRHRPAFSVRRSAHPARRIPPLHFVASSGASAENRQAAASIRRLLFNIRISTEDEINGTVKWLV